MRMLRPIVWCCTISVWILSPSLALAAVEGCYSMENSVDYYLMENGTDRYLMEGGGVCGAVGGTTAPGGLGASWW